MRYALVRSGACFVSQPRTIHGSFRTFEDTPRADGKAAAGMAWEGNRVAMKLQATYAINPPDGQEWWPDDSYFGLRGQLDVLGRICRSMVGTGLARQPDPVD